MDNDINLFINMLPVSNSVTKLRTMQVGDLDVFKQYRADHELARFQSWSPISECEALEFIQEMSETQNLKMGEWFQLTICSNETDLMLGDIGLCIEANRDFAEIGFTLSKEAQHKGHAIRAVNLAVKILIDHYNVKNIVAVTDERNLPSIKVLTRAGFELTERREAVFKGELCTEMIFSYKSRGLCHKSE